MIKKIVGIFICLLLICTIFTATANVIVDKTYNSINSGNTTYGGSVELGKKDFFGSSVSMDGNCIIIGAPSRDSDNGKGSVYIFNHDVSSWKSWKMKQKLTGPHDFGHSVSICGDYAIVGSSEENSAYIFKNDGTNWVEDAILKPSDSYFADIFGYSVSISGDYAIVGNPRSHCDLLHGSAYIFKHEEKGWVEDYILNVNEGGDDQFGNSVSIDGDYAVVGAYYENKTRGAVYIFKRDGLLWSQQAKIIAPDGEDGDRFGHSVSINDNSVIIGADAHDEIGYNSGSAYVFKHNGTSWEMEKKLIPIYYFGPWYGSSVSIDGEYAIVASYLEKKAYIFKRNSLEWSLDARLVASNVDKQTYYGYSVYIKDNYAIVGAYNMLPSWVLKDEVYIYKCIGNEWYLENILYTIPKNRQINFQYSDFWSRLIDMFSILQGMLDL